MREILFRGKRKDNGEWVYGALINVGDFCCILPDDDGSNYDYPYLDSDLGIIHGQAVPVIPETVGQYTGVNDDRYTKIFEGDILKSLDSPNLLCSVIFNEGCASFQSQECDGYSDFFLSTINPSETEIVGNIHDNPELLDVENPDFSRIRESCKCYGCNDRD